MTARKPPPTPEQIERGLSPLSRLALTQSRDGCVCGDAGSGHTNNALRRRGLLTDRLTWDHGGWLRPLTPLGIEVAALARNSTRKGGGKHRGRQP